MILYANTSDFLKWKNIYIVKFKVAHWDILDDGLPFLYARGNVFEHLNGKCHVFTCKKKVFFSIQMISVICVHFSQLVDHCVTS